MHNKHLFQSKKKSISTKIPLHFLQTKQKIGEKSDINDVIHTVMAIIGVSLDQIFLFNFFIFEIRAFIFVLFFFFYV
jgi:hypothetical protein